MGGELPGIGDGMPPGLSVGSRIAGYRLGEQIGAGGMAVVFKAVDTRLGRLVALKVLTTERADVAVRERFLQESKAAAAVDHPHLIPVHEAGEAAGVLFIAMRYVAGGDVGSLLRCGEPLSAERTAAIISPVASALDAAHAEGLVHRDVKPANMLLDVRPGEPDHVYLADFGICRLTRAAGLTGAGQFLGTVEYAAPEQIRGAVVDGRADQYALACTAFELLSGRPPFRGNDALAVTWAQLTESPPPLTSRRPGLPPGVDVVLAKALAKAPEGRYATCRDFASALRGALRLPSYDSGALTSYDPEAPVIRYDGPGQAGRLEKAATHLQADPALSAATIDSPAGGRPSPPATSGVTAPAPEPGPRPASSRHRRLRRLLVSSLALVIAAAGLAVGVRIATSGAKSANSLGVASSPIASTCQAKNGPAFLSLFPATTDQNTVTIGGIVTIPRGTVLRDINWNWGDGTTETGCSYFPETHVYPIGRRYTVVVTATLSSGSQLHATEMVSLPASGMACQTTNGTSSLSLFPAAVSGLAVTINGVVIAPRGTVLTGIDWDWGDGTTQRGCAYFPEAHDYAGAGRYTVVVTTTFSNGSKKRATEAVSVAPVTSGANSAPATSGASSPAAAACSTANGTSSLSLFPANVSKRTVTINGVVIAPRGTVLTGIDWNWGDGTTQRGCAYFPEIHTYAKAGRYTVAVTTTFSNGSKKEATETVSVPAATSATSSAPAPTPTPAPATSEASSPPAAACSTTNGTSSLSLFAATISGLSVTINGVVIAPQGTVLTGIDWNWGDGTTQTGCDYFPETHNYASVGQYTVVVTTTFSDGTDLQATETVSVS